MKKSERALALLLTLCLLLSGTTFALAEEPALVVEDIVENVVEEIVVPTPEEELVAPVEPESEIDEAEEIAETVDPFTDVTELPPVDIAPEEIPALPTEAAEEEIPQLPADTAPRGGCEHRYTYSYDYIDTSEEPNPFGVIPGDPMYHSIKGRRTTKIICLECGDTVEVVPGATGSFRERHVFDYDGVCGICRYILNCTHTYVRSYTEYYLDYERCVSYNDKLHTVPATELLATICSTCENYDNEFVRELILYREHEFGLDGSCLECGYANAKVCAHTRTHTVEYSTDVTYAQPFSTNSHSYKCAPCTDVVCNDCGIVLSTTMGTETFNHLEPHDFVGGYCQTCLYENNCPHTYKSIVSGWYDNYFRKGSVEIIDATQHKATGEWATYTLCSDCGERMNIRSTMQTRTEAHNFDANGICTVCGATSAPVKPTRVTLLPGDAQKLGIGDELYLRATVEPDNAAAEISWKSSNESIATVDAYGYVTGVGKGTATITVTAKGAATKTASVKVTVYDPYALTGATIIPSAPMYLGLGDSTMLVAEPIPVSADSDVVWKSSKPGVVFVEQDGTIYGDGLGTATVTATLTRNGVTKTASVKVTVSAPDAIASLSLVGEKGFTLRLDKDPDEEVTDQLYAVIQPASAISNTDVTWKSSNTKVAEVSSDGLVTAVSPGTATITATGVSSCGKFKKTASVKITVIDPFKPNGVSIGISPTSDDFAPVDKVFRSELPKDNFYGTPQYLIATLAPFADAYAQYSWKSSNENVAAIIDAGQFAGMFPIGAGTATITVTATRGGVSKSASFKVTVTDAYKPAKVTLDEKAFTLELNKDLDETVTKALTPTVEPADIAVINTWKSSNEKVATVESDGTVTAVGAGTATITVTAARGTSKKTATCKVTVVDPYKPTKVTLNEKAFTLKLGAYASENESVTLLSTLEPYDDADVTYTWKSSNEKVATVAAGVVEAVGAGSATITVTAVRGTVTKSATCKVTVVDPYKPTAVKLNYSGTAKVNLGLLSDVTGDDSEELILSATLQPETAVDVEYEWKSSNKAIADVSSEGVVHPYKPGTVTITCTANRCGVKKSATVRVTVVDPYAITDFTLGTESVVRLKIGETIEPTWNVQPRNDAGYGVIVSFKSTGVVGWNSNVSTDLTIRAKAVGTATVSIEVERLGRKKTKSFKIIVSK